MQSTARVISVGDRHAVKRLILQEDVAKFGNLINDHNPIHTDAVAAQAAGFPGTIAHGMLAGSLFSGLMATTIPGPNSIYLSQTLNFKAPIFVGEEVEAAVEVMQFRRNKGLVLLRTTVTKASPDAKEPVVCVEGTSVCMNKTVEFSGESEWTVQR